MEKKTNLVCVWMLLLMRRRDWLISAGNFERPPKRQNAANISLAQSLNDTGKNDMDCMVARPNKIEKAKSSKMRKFSLIIF